MNYVSQMMNAQWGDVSRLGWIGPAETAFSRDLNESTNTDHHYFPHHPVICPGTIRYNEDDTFECDHLKLSSDDPRTRLMISRSICHLLMEIVSKHEAAGKRYPYHEAEGSGEGS